MTHVPFDPETDTVWGLVLFAGANEQLNARRRWHLRFRDGVACESHTSAEIRPAGSMGFQQWLSAARKPPVCERCAAAFRPLVSFIAKLDPKPIAATERTPRQPAVPRKGGLWFASQAEVVEYVAFLRGGDDA